MSLIKKGNLITFAARLSVNPIKKRFTSSLHPFHDRHPFLFRPSRLLIHSPAVTLSCSETERRDLEAKLHQMMRRQNERYVSQFFTPRALSSLSLFSVQFLIGHTTASQLAAQLLLPPLLCHIGHYVSGYSPLQASGTGDGDTDASQQDQQSQRIILSSGTSQPAI